MKICKEQGMDIKKILFKTNEIDVERALPDAILYCNKDGKILWVNEKAVELFETSKMHLLTSNITDFIENSQNLIKVASNNDIKVITKLVGQEVYYEMTSKEIDEGFVLAFRNSNNSQATLPNHLNRDSASLDVDMKNAFLLKLANDFKSPLQSIVGFSQAMSDGLGGEMTEQQEKYIKIINKHSTDLMYFIGKLLDLSQAESNNKSPDLKVFDIISLVNSIVKFNEQLYKDKDVRLSVDIEEGLKKTIVSDEDIIKNIIQNLLEIILKSVEMGDIIVSLSNPDEETVKSKNIFGANFVKISISSSSLLLSENDLEYMLDPYKIVDSSNRKNLLRSMILANVKNLTQNLNGVFWIESQILKNTTFNIIIPQGKN